MVLKYCKQLGVGLVLSALAATAGAQVQVRDDAGQMVTLNAPARRVISLAPHVTELIYAAGGGARLVEWSATVITPRRPSRCRAWGTIARWISSGCWP